MKKIVNQLNYNYESKNGLIKFAPNQSSPFSELLDIADSFLQHSQINGCFILPNQNTAIFCQVKKNNRSQLQLRIYNSYNQLLNKINIISFQTDRSGLLDNLTLISKPNHINLSVFFAILSNDGQRVRIFNVIYDINGNIIKPIKRLAEFTYNDFNTHFQIAILSDNRFLIACGDKISFIEYSFADMLPISSSVLYTEIPANQLIRILVASDNKIFFYYQDQSGSILRKSLIREMDSNPLRLSDITQTIKENKISKFKIEPTILKTSDLQEIIGFLSYQEDKDIKINPIYSNGTMGDIINININGSLRDFIVIDENNLLTVYSLDSASNQKQILGRLVTFSESKNQYISSLEFEVPSSKIIISNQNKTSFKDNQLQILIIEDKKPTQIKTSKFNFKNVEFYQNSASETASNTASSSNSATRSISASSSPIIPSTSIRVSSTYSLSNSNSEYYLNSSLQSNFNLSAPNNSISFDTNSSLAIATQVNNPLDWQLISLSAIGGSIFTILLLLIPYFLGKRRGDRAYSNMIDLDEQVPGQSSLNFHNSQMEAYIRQLEELDRQLQISENGKRKAQQELNRITQNFLSQVPDIVEFKELIIALNSRLEYKNILLNEKIIELEKAQENITKLENTILDLRQQLEQLTDNLEKKKKPVEDKINTLEPDTASSSSHPFRSVSLISGQQVKNIQKSL